MKAGLCVFFSTPDSLYGILILNNVLGNGRMSKRGESRPPQGLTFQALLFGATERIALTMNLYLTQIHTHKGWTEQSCMHVLTLTHISLDVPVAQDGHANLTCPTDSVCPTTEVMVPSLCTVASSAPRHTHSSDM